MPGTAKSCGKSYLNHKGWQMTSARGRINGVDVYQSLEASKEQDISKEGFVKPSFIKSKANHYMKSSPIFQIDILIVLIHEVAML